MMQADTDPYYRKPKVHKAVARPGPAPRTPYEISRAKAKQIKGASFGRSLTNGICDTLWKRVRKHKQGQPQYACHEHSRSEVARLRVLKPQAGPKPQHKDEKAAVPDFVKFAARAAMQVFMKKHERRGG